MKEKKARKSRTFNAIRNVIYNFAYQIINTITNIILPPLIIGKFGSVINGLISTIKQIINYVQLVGAGISESTVVSLYKPLEEQDNNKVGEIYNASSKAFNKSGIIFSVISVLLAFIYPLFINEQLEYDFVVKIVIILAFAGVSEFFAIGKYRTLLTADQKMYMVNVAQIVGSVLSTVMTILLIKLNCSIIAVQLVATITYICRIGILYLYIHKNYKYLDKQAKPDYSAISKRKAATLHQVASLVIFGSQTLFIAKFCGLAEASVYSVYNLVFTGLNTVLSTISSAMLAGMGSLMSTGNNEKVKKVYNLYEFGYYILVFTFYITAFLMITPFIKLYTNGITDANYIRPELIILFTIMGLLNCLRTPGATMINAKGFYDETKNRALIEMTICLIGQAIFVGKLGIVGVLLGTILAYLYRTLDVIIYSNKKIVKQSTLKTFIRIIVNTVVMSIIVLVININVEINNYFSWIIYAGITFIIAFAIMTSVNIVNDFESAKTGKEYIMNILKKNDKKD